MIYEVSPWDDGNHPVRSKVFVPELSVLVGQLHVNTLSQVRKVINSAEMFFLVILVRSKYIFGEPM